MQALQVMTRHAGSMTTSSPSSTHRLTTVVPSAKCGNRHRPTGRATVAIMLCLCNALAMPSLSFGCEVWGCSGRAVEHGQVGQLEQNYVDQV
jgi:hypothetical protein